MGIASAVSRRRMKDTRPRALGGPAGSVAASLEPPEIDSSR